METIYNKNLKKSLEITSSQQPGSALNLPTDSRLRVSALRSIDTQQQQQQLMHKEPTELSTTTTTFTDAVNSETDTSEDNRHSTYMNDFGVSEYTSACHALRIVPCSIVLKSLRNMSIVLSNYGLGPLGTLALTNALKYNTTVIKLDLSCNEIGPMGVKYLANLFGENTTILDLNLAKNYIGSQGVPHLIEMFKNNKYLRSVDLSNNELNDDDGIAFFNAIEDHPVTKLNMSYNKLSDKSGAVIGPWLADNLHLFELNLSWNHFRKRAGVAIAKGLSVKHITISLFSFIF